MSRSIAYTIGMALAYLFVIELIVCTKPDHHAKAVSLVHYVTLGIIFHGSIRDTTPISLYRLGTEGRGSE